jgi:hypothetical protein
MIKQNKKTARKKLNSEKTEQISSNKAKNSDTRNSNTFINDM